LYAKKNDEQDMADKIVELLDSPKLRKKMGQFGRNRVLNALEWKYEAPKLLKAYDVLFNSKS
jgi:glycosyltransferase involved in cell wall biosynthesis